MAKPTHGRGAQIVRTGRGDMIAKSAPAAVQRAEYAAGMFNRPFGPGAPLSPAAGYSVTPRSFDFSTGYNISTRPRNDERMSFEVLTALVNSYDVAMMAINHRIDSIRSLDYNLQPLPEVTKNVDDLLYQGKRIMKKPDRVRRFKTWLYLYLWDVLAYDAGALYRMRNKANQVVGLKHVDGTTIAPLIDDYGDTPGGDAPAYMQFVQGIPWSELTTSDMIYEPFRPSTKSLYGKSPIEFVIMNANTDLRFQAYFMSRFTDGNVPEAFAGAPEGWTPDQISAFQESFDALVYGDDKVKHQVKWVPNGTTFAWSNEKDFSDAFSLFLMRKTCAAYHVQPTELGFTETANRAISETQADITYRVGDLPLIQHIEELISDFLQDDCYLPLEFKFERGVEVQDSYVEAQAKKLYVEMGALSVDEVRADTLGLKVDSEMPVPRFIMDVKAGPIPLSELFKVAGRTDPETMAPDPDAPLDLGQFAGVGGVLPSTVLARAGAMINPDEPQYPQLEGATDRPLVAPQVPIAKSQDTDGGSEDPVAVLKSQVEAEVKLFRRYVAKRRREGTWRPFTFGVTPTLAAHRLNDAGRAVVRKAAGQLVAAGLCVQAADTGRVLMLQRALDPTDPAGGFWEFPGGHIEDGETPLSAACREWQEETGCLLPMGAVVGMDPQGWTGSNGIYQGYVITVDSEAQIPIGARGQCTNPDDPDGDSIESLAWWKAAAMAGNPAIRPELAQDVDVVLGALGQGEVVDSVGAVIKGTDPRWDVHPVRAAEAALVPSGADQIRDALASSVTRDQLKAVAAAYIASRSVDG